MIENDLKVLETYIQKPNKFTKEKLLSRIPYLKLDHSSLSENIKHFYHDALYHSIQNNDIVIVDALFDQAKNYSSNHNIYGAGYDELYNNLLFQALRLNYSNFTFDELKHKFLKYLSTIKVYEATVKQLVLYVFRNSRRNYQAFDIINNFCDYLKNLATTNRFEVGYYLCIHTIEFKNEHKLKVKIWNGGILSVDSWLNIKRYKEIFEKGMR